MELLLQPTPHDLLAVLMLDDAHKAAGAHASEATYSVP